jgi:hypothetical protein
MPKIVKERIDEYINNCQSQYKSLYTAQQGVSSAALVPLSLAFSIFEVKPEGILKDSYNHIIGVTFKYGTTKDLVVLPVVDDGIISISSVFTAKNIYLDWEEINPASAEDIIKYYKNNFENQLGLYPGYYIKKIIKKTNTKVIALQLANGLYIPASSPKDISVLDNLKIKIEIQQKEFEWDINKQIDGIKPVYDIKEDISTITKDITVEKRCGFDSELIRQSSYVKFEELYQQFRFMVSNWLTGIQAGSGIRKEIENIIFNTDLPEYERRKRLYIFISSELLSWFYPDKNAWETPATFLRKDCRVINTPETCTGTCYWNTDTNKCLLHVDSKTELGDKPGERDVSTPELYTKRIVDELIRFPARRNQLLKRNGEKISAVSTIIQPIRQGDQYIIPESSPTWTNLLRLDWMIDTPEKPEYYEEMSRTEDKEINTPFEEKIPEKLQEILGESKSIRIEFPDIINTQSPLEPVLTKIGITVEDFGIKDKSSDKITEENLSKYVLLKKRSIAVINVKTNTNTPTIMVKRPKRSLYNDICIIVVLPEKIGLIVEVNGDPFIEINGLSKTLRDIWEKTSPTIKLKKPQEVVTQTQIIPGENPPRIDRQQQFQIPIVSNPAPIRVSNKKNRRVINVVNKSKT